MNPMNFNDDYGCIGIVGTSSLVCEVNWIYFITNLLKLYVWINANNMAVKWYFFWFTIICCIKKFINLLI